MHSPIRSVIRVSAIGVVLATSAHVCGQPASTRPTTTAPAQPADRVARIRDDDPRLVAATAEARQKYPTFIAALRDRKPNEAYAVKRRFVDGDKTEQMWIQVRFADDKSIVGIVDNNPVVVTNVKRGDLVTMPTAELQDWLYTVNGQIVGAFTVPVLEAAEREAGAK